MSYQLFGRAIKNEYLSLGTILTAVAIGYAATGGSKKEAPSGSVQEQIQKVKQSVPLNASSSEEEQLMDSIKKFIDEEEKKSHH